MEDFIINWSFKNDYFCDRKNVLIKTKKNSKLNVFVTFLENEYFFLKSWRKVQSVSLSVSRYEFLDAQYSLCPL